MTTNPILVEVYRGDMVESFHRGAVAAVDNNGYSLFQLGEIRSFAYLRSAAKPFQVIPLIAYGAIDIFGFDNEDIAIMCGSHNGEPTHIEKVAGVLKKTGLDENHLKCGIHPPLDRETARSIKQTGGTYSPLHNNCSGKHAAMLAGSVLRGFDLNDYLSREHPWQKAIISVIAEMGDYSPGEMIIGVDGCGAPVHALPLYNCALAAARLAVPTGISKINAIACEKIFPAIVENPYLIAGRGRFCTDLIETGGGAVAAKAGAEGFYMVSIRRENKGIGIVVKIDDGAQRARDPVVIEALRKLGVLNYEQVDKLERHYKHAILNHAGEKVGEVKVVGINRDDEA